MTKHYHVTRIGIAEHEKRMHTVALNLARRHLTDAQKVALGMTIEPDVAEAARARMERGMPTNPKDNCPEGQTRDEFRLTASPSRRTCCQSTSVTIS